MPGVTQTRTIDALLSTTLANYRNKLEDNIFDQYPLLSWLNGKLGTISRGSKLKKLKDGGETIIEQLMYEVNTTANSYAGYEVLDTTPQDGITWAQYNWKQYSASLTISGAEESKNRGEAKLISLLEGKAKQAEMSLRKTMATDAYGDGTGNNGKAFTGLAALVSATATVGGLDPATYTWWKAVTGTSSSFAANGLDTLKTAINSCAYGADAPDAMFTTQTIYEYYEDYCEGLKRFVSNEKAAEAGFANLMYKGVPMYFDRSCTAGKVYILNSNYLNFNVMSDKDLITTPFVKPENQDARTAQILFMGNITVPNRRMHGVVTVSAA